MFTLPDLVVDDVSCDSVAGAVRVGAHIRNGGTAPTPGPFDMSATTDPASDPTQRDITASQGPLAINERHFFPIWTIPDVNSDKLDRTVFEIDVNPPEVGAPHGKLIELNLQNNRMCGVCTCTQRVCQVSPSPMCVLPGP
jgi:hypothetical protein